MTAIDCLDESRPDVTSIGKTLCQAINLAGDATAPTTRSLLPRRLNVSVKLNNPKPPPSYRNDRVSSRGGS
jgi:hypothetical protein